VFPYVAAENRLALNAADRGFVPFPMGVNSAEPAFPEGDAMATKSNVMLRHWWEEENPKALGRPRRRFYRLTRSGRALAKSALLKLTIVNNIRLIPTGD